MARDIRLVTPSKFVLPLKKRVAAYARVSTGKDAMLHSLSAQVSYYSEYIQKNSQWEYIGVYADEALSGTKEARAEFQRLLSDCRAGLIDMVITKSISRFARNTVTMLEAVRELKLLNVDVYFEKENTHSISGDGELMLSILASFAQEESLSVSENCKWRIRNNFKDGVPNTFEVYGYKVSKGKLEINPKEAKIVKMIFDEYLLGNGRLVIAKKLNSLGIKTKNNKEWDSCKIKEILRNEKYAGDLLLQKKYVNNHMEKKTLLNDGRLPQYYVSSNHEAIIDRDTYDKVHEEFQKRKEKYTTGTSTVNTYPFSGILVCCKCGAHFHRKLNNVGSKYQKAVWICATYNKMGKAHCNARQIPEQILMLMASEVLGSKDFDERVFKQKIKEILIPVNNRLTFIFHDGHIENKEWAYPSRSESWSDEARLKAKEQNLMRLERGDSQ